jgi:hypothetical protein
MFSLHDVLVLFRSRNRLVTKKDLEKTEEKIMSAISDAVATLNASDDRIAASITAVAADIAKLVAGQGTVTPADQALLDAIVARNESIALRLEALDAQTPE